MKTEHPQYRIDCASSDNTPACRQVYSDEPKSVRRSAAQLRRYYTSVVIKTYYGIDITTQEPTYLVDESSY